MPCSGSVVEGWNCLCSVPDSPILPSQQPNPCPLYSIQVTHCWLLPINYPKPWKLPIYHWLPEALFSWSKQFSRHLAMLSAQSSVCVVLVSYFSSYFTFSLRYFQWLFALRKERKTMEIIHKDREAMHIIQEWNMVLNFLEHWIWIVWCVGCSSKLYMYTGKCI